MKESILHLPETEGGFGDPLKRVPHLYIWEAEGME
jgi:hypothetical protein